MNRQHPHGRRPLALLVAALAGLALTGCVVAPVGEPYYDSGSTYYGGGSYYDNGYADGFYNGTYYPAIPHEVVPVAPYAGALWVSGYWDLDRGHRRWIPGRYERPGYNRPGWRPDDHRPGWNNGRPDRPGWNHNRPDNNRPRPNRPTGADRPVGNPGNGAVIRRPPGQVNPPLIRSSSGTGDGG
ncbi:hypothetical protein CCO03_10245 [Comamonas serinivorans]|uniref:BcpO-related WXXGXW repeat protein n=1 Tax=Comamonas serinivorans TaxID=1082851 RepID=A0A1Y0EMX9_9BURK|nr:YXWGXW repeat-containing protein [Comamonas serinivorans]ARU05015.1 hypothetical protein CCO03_10245 [Comamonas serinivorans]